MFKGQRNDSQFAIIVYRWAQQNCEHIRSCDWRSICPGEKGNVCSAWVRLRPAHDLNKSKLEITTGDGREQMYLKELSWMIGLQTVSLLIIITNWRDSRMNEQKLKAIFNHTQWHTLRHQCNKLSTDHLIIESMKSYSFHWFVNSWCLISRKNQTLDLILLY